VDRASLTFFLRGRRTRPGRQTQRPIRREGVLMLQQPCSPSAHAVSLRLRRRDPDGA